MTLEDDLAEREGKSVELLVNEFNKILKEHRPFGPTVFSMALGLVMAELMYASKEPELIYTQMNTYCLHVFHEMSVNEDSN